MALSNGRLGRRMVSTGEDIRHLPRIISEWGFGWAERIQSADEGGAHDHSRFTMRHYKPLRTLLVCISQSFFAKRGIEKKQSPCYRMALSKGCLLVRTVTKMLLLEKGGKTQTFN